MEIAPCSLAPHTPYVLQMSHWFRRHWRRSRAAFLRHATGLPQKTSACQRQARLDQLSKDSVTVGWGHHPWNGTSNGDRHAADGMLASEGMLSATLTHIADACQRRPAQWPGNLCMSTLSMLSCKSHTCAVHVRYRKNFREIYT